MNLRTRLGIFPSLVIGIALFAVGLVTTNSIVNNWWPLDVERIDLVRATALDQVDAASILEAPNIEIILVLLATVAVTVAGAALPIAYLLNKRLSLYANRQLDQTKAPRFLVTLRQSVAVGLWAAVCLWLQMNRALGIAVALLIAAVLILFELLLQLRTRAADLKQ
ncbi:MAG: hypothetical protein KC419_12750 [Anaerolineales bacterium]|nr:hypothetical protein [Anaerolineales bacterium]MCA9929348.1 hypothetical protein [Anaerolineales bacterium]